MIAHGEGNDGGAGEGGAADGAGGGIVEVKRGGAGLHHVPGFAGQGIDEVLLFKFGDEGLAGGDEGFELPGLAAEVAEEPEALHDAGGFGGEVFEEREVGGGEAAEAVALEIEHADDLIVVDHGGGHLAAGGGAHGDVARFGGDVGDEERAAVQHAPAGDAVAEFQLGVGGVGGLAGLHFGLEVAGVGAEEGDGAGVGVKRGHEEIEHLAERDLRIVGLGAEGGEAVERGQGAGIGGKGNLRAGGGICAGGHGGQLCGAAGVRSTWPAAAGSAGGVRGWRREVATYLARVAAGAGAGAGAITSFIASRRATRRAGLSTGSWLALSM